MPREPWCAGRCTAFVMVGGAACAMVCGMVGGTVCTMVCGMVWAVGGAVGAV